MAEFRGLTDKLRNQGLSVRRSVDDDGPLYFVEGFVLRPAQMVELDREGKLTLAGIQELHERLKS